MPMKSQAQRRWMWATHPKMARRWEAHTPDKSLPEKVACLLNILEYGMEKSAGFLSNFITPARPIPKTLDTLNTFIPRLSPYFQGLHKNVQRNFPADTTMAGKIADSGPVGWAANKITAGITAGGTVRNMAPGSSVISSFGKYDPRYKPAMDSIQTNINMAASDRTGNMARVGALNRANTQYGDFSKNRLQGMYQDFLGRARTQADTQYVNTAFPRQRAASDSIAAASKQTPASRPIVATPKISTAPIQMPKQNTL